MSTTPLVSLGALRTVMDDIDDRIAELLAKRLIHSRTIRKFKAARGLPAHDPEREARIVGRFADPDVARMFAAILEVCRGA